MPQFIDEGNPVRRTFLTKRGAQRSKAGTSIIRKHLVHQKVTKKEWLDLYTVENLGPSSSKSKVFKVKSNRSNIKSYRNCNRTR